MLPIMRGKSETVFCEISQSDFKTSVFRLIGYKIPTFWHKNDSFSS